MRDTTAPDIAEGENSRALHTIWADEFMDRRGDPEHVPDPICVGDNLLEMTQAGDTDQFVSPSSVNEDEVLTDVHAAPSDVAATPVQDAPAAESPKMHSDAPAGVAPPTANVSAPKPEAPLDTAATLAQQAMHSLASDLRQVRLLSGQDELEPALAVIEFHLRNLQREQAAAYSRDTEQTRPPEAEDVDQHRSAQREVAALRADMRWRLACRTRKTEDFSQAAQAWETYLAYVPDDVSAMSCLGECLLDQASAEQEELAKAALLQRGADVLGQVVDAVEAPDRKSLGLLGEALCRYAMSGMAVNEAVLAQAEDVLRRAMDGGSADDSHAAWWLQTLLAVQLPGKDAAVLLARLQESIAMLRQGVSASGSSPGRIRWQSALLHAELEEVLRAPIGAASRRLRLIDLHARYAETMNGEAAPEVLAAWVDLLCACARALTGSAAMKRYQEIDDMLARLSSSDPDGRWYKASWMDMLHGRLLLENEGGKRNLLARTENLLAGRWNASPSLRLETSKLALMRAALEEDAHVQQRAYMRALELARPLTAVPSLAVPALQCALKALLAMQENKERRVYARCLQILMPTDGQSLALLAESAYQDDMPADACRYLEQAIRAQGARLPDPMYNLWHDASSRWAEQSGRDDEWQRNRRQLRLAAGVS